MSPAPRLSRCQQRVYDAITSGMVCNARSVESAASSLQLSTRTYRRALVQLAAWGLIARTPYHPRRAYSTPLLHQGDA